jgi:beta-lactamase regulating signal transducer with metallopeptidase domain
MVYLLKVTLAWALFLLLFEAFYKSNGRFTLNRFYLLLSMAVGLLLPLIPLPSSAPQAVAATQALYPAALAATPDAMTTTVVPLTQATNGLNLWQLVVVLYGLGIAFLTLKALWESGRIIQLILHSPRRMVAGHQVIITGRHHAPYSFMGWIFMGDLHAYQPVELKYIILHEAAHNEKKHWLDLLLLQLACIVLWFHPLIWRYRYLLQLQHEYEADKVAARNNAFAYGHFLLQQTLLNGVPSIAHSFHFLPIKNRIKMLTKKQNQKPGGWKYVLIVPALLGCTFLMAKTTATKVERLRQGDITTFKGNSIKWRTDIKVKNQIVYNLNGEQVYQNESLKMPATYGSTERAYEDYINDEFAKISKRTKDSMTKVRFANIVVNKEGKVVYYESRYFKPYINYVQKQNYWQPYPDQDPALDAIVDKIVEEGPKWKPAGVGEQTVNSVVNFGIGEGC